MSNAGNVESGETKLHSLFNAYVSNNKGRVYSSMIPGSSIASARGAASFGIWE